MPILLLILFAVVAEVTVVVTVGGLIGLLPTLALLVAGTFLGVFLLRREGTKALEALRQAAFARRQPEGELVDGMLITAAGILVFLPGFLSDIVAISLLLPPSRALVRRWVLRRAQRAAPGPVVVDSIVVDAERVRPTMIVIPAAQRADDDQGPTIV
ncbi:FxsA family protein [Actinokineospora pegani]|uniref:FxsA family protein n=1 Tax=Actinokineospora pegani TaxID=2654637 RepID=UPI001F4375C9|nr:FxsA family protein [Actinokineospora pegani]